MPRVAELLEELKSIAEQASFTLNGQTSQLFDGRTFCVINIDEFNEVSEYQGFPICAVAYESAEPQGAVTPADGRPGRRSAATVVEMTFTIVVGVEYNHSAMVQAGGVDTKFVATDLLDVLRGRILGFQGVNDRPWRLVSEGPTEQVINGVALYGQMWATSVVHLNDDA